MSAYSMNSRLPGPSQHQATEIQSSELAPANSNSTHILHFSIDLEVTNRAVNPLLLDIWMLDPNCHSDLLPQIAWLFTADCRSHGTNSIF